MRMLLSVTAPTAAASCNGVMTVLSQLPHTLACIALLVMVSAHTSKAYGCALEKKCSACDHH